MATYKSSAGIPRRAEAPAPATSQYGQPTRIPTRSVTPTAARPGPASSQIPRGLKKTERDARPPPSERRAGAATVPGERAEGKSVPRREQQRTQPYIQVPSDQKANKFLRQPASRLPKFDMVSNTRTPSLVSGSSASTADSPRSLRRKPSSIGRPPAVTPARPRRDSSSSIEDSPSSAIIPKPYGDPFAETVFGISLPPSSTIYAHKDPEIGESNESAELPFQLDNLTAPHFQAPQTYTPSTMYSPSPSTFSHISTSTSLSSQSPGLVLSQKSGSNTRQMSPLHSKPPVSRRLADASNLRNTKALSAVRESSTSSSSASTVMNDDIKKNKEKKALAPLSTSFSTAAAPFTSPQEPEIVAKEQEPEPEKKPVPPEFAHLAVEPAQVKAQPRVPLRPSRDGASDISSFREPSPIIQSNLAYLPSHRRQNSSGSRPGVASPASAASSQEHIPTLTKTTSRGASPNPNVVNRYGYGSSRIPTSRGPTPDFPSDSDSSVRRGRNATAPSPSKSPRFGFLSRRAKTDPTPTAPKPEKKLRKGPSAGTGHEKYGRYATRGRSGSVSSANGSIGRSTSADSNSASFQRTPSSRKSSVTSNSGTEVDEYFRDRLTPVIIRGNGSAGDLCKSPEDFRSSNSLDSARDALSPDLQPASSVASSEALSEVENRPTLLPSAMTDRVASPKKRFGLGIRRPSDSDDDRKRAARATLKKRGSFRKSQALNDTAAKIGDISEGKEGHWLKPRAPQPQTKPARRWNFFQRAQAVPKTEELTSDAASIHRVPSRSIAHYAVVGGEDDLKIEDIEKLMEEANEDTDGEGLLDSDPTPNYEATGRANKDYVQSVLLPSPPAISASFAQSRSMSPKVMLRKDSDTERVSQDNTTTNILPFGNATEAALPEQAELDIGGPEKDARPRPSRLALAQFGRIPQVISQRDRDRKLPSQSFSRPFAPSQPSPAVHVPRTSIDSVSPGVPAEYNVIPTAAPTFTSLNSHIGDAASGSFKAAADATETSEEFLAFPARKDSELSYSSSSGKWSLPASIAVKPKPGSPLTEDEIWKEYDDLIDDVLSPSVLDSGCGSPVGTPLFDAVFWKPESEVDASDDANASKKKSSMENLTSPGTTKSFHLRRSRLLSILHAPSPGSATSFPEHVRGDRPISILDPVTGRLSMPSARGSTGSAKARSSLPMSIGSGARNSKSTVGSGAENRLSNRYRDTRLMEMAETQNDGLVSMANLRFGALMTSKWLSFGRVLFSPVHHELKDINEDRVLVVDGLGKDWSFYCALTYPEAMVYNLDPNPSATEPSGSSGPWSSLPNHRHVHHSTSSSSFPFPKGFFAAVVYRFPPSSPESVYKTAIVECKRVLRPGGYLEVSVLDLDLINMGNRSRKAIRSLKLQMQAAEPAVCLRPASDLIMGLVGKRGFENLNRCLVGVPVAAGRLRSGSGSSSNGSVRSDRARLAANNAKQLSSNPDASTNAFSYTDLLNSTASEDNGRNSETDASITDMVARVGRWWYSRCHEAGVLPEGDLNRSLWKDRALLRECEKQGTSFRLLIAFAQKPACARRRTVSV